MNIKYNYVFFFTFQTCLHCLNINKCNEDNFVILSDQIKVNESIERNFRAIKFNIRKCYM